MWSAVFLQFFVEKRRNPCVKDMYKIKFYVKESETMLIAIDHGNKQMKSVHCPPFVSGLSQSNTEPYGREILRYGDFFYTLSDQRIPYHKDKSEDDRFFILTLFAIAAEIETQGRDEEGLIHIRLAIGVPPAYYGSQGKALVNYFKNRSVVQFLYKRKKYAIYIEDVRCYPQAYAAAATLLQSLVESPRALILDIGGHTADYIVMRNGKPNFNSLQSCDSLENGVDVFYNRACRSKCGKGHSAGGERD